MNKKLFAIGLILLVTFALTVSTALAAPVSQDEDPVPPPGFPGLEIIIGGLSVGAVIIFPLTQLLKRFNVPDGVGGFIAIVLAAVAALFVQLGIDVPSIGVALPGIVEGVATLLDLILKFVTLVGGSLGAFKVGRAMLPGRV
jgi:hypothetical protein